MNKTYSGHITEELLMFSPPPKNLPEETEKVIQYILNNPLEEIPQDLKPACRFYYKDMEHPWTFYLMMANGADLETLLSALSGLKTRKTRFFFLRQLLAIHGLTNEIYRLVAQECQALKKEKNFNEFHRPLLNLLVTYNEKKELFNAKEKKHLINVTKTLLKTLLKLEEEVLPLMPLCDKLSINFADIGLKQTQIFALHIKQGKEKNLISAARLCQNKEQEALYTQLFSNLLVSNSIEPNTVEHKVQWDKITAKRVIKSTIEWLKTKEKICGIKILEKLIGKTPKTREYKRILDYVSTSPSDPASTVKVLSQLSFSWRKMLRKYPKLAPILSDKKAVSIAKNKEKLLQALLLHFLKSKQYEKAFEILDEVKSPNEWVEPITRLLKESLQAFPSRWLHYYFILPEANQKKLLKEHYLEIREAVSQVINQEKKGFPYYDLFRFFNEKASFEVSLLEKSIFACPTIDLKIATSLFPLLKRYSSSQFKCAKSLDLAINPKRKTPKDRNPLDLPTDEVAVTLDQVHLGILIKLWATIIMKLKKEEAIEIIIDQVDEIEKIFEHSDPHIHLLMARKLCAILKEPAANPELLIKQIDACQTMSIPITKNAIREVGPSFISQISIPMIKLQAHDPRPNSGERLLDILRGVEGVTSHGVKAPTKEISDAIDTFLDKQGFSFDPTEFLCLLTKWNFKYYSFTKCSLFLIKHSPESFEKFLSLFKQISELTIDLTHSDSELIIEQLKKCDLVVAIDCGIKYLSLPQVHETLTHSQRAGLIDELWRDARISKKIQKVLAGNNQVRNLTDKEIYYLTFEAMQRFKGKENSTQFTQFCRLLINEAEFRSLRSLPFLFASRLKIAYDRQIHDLLIKQTEIYFDGVFTNDIRKQVAVDFLVLAGVILDEPYREETFAKARVFYRKLFPNPGHFDFLTLQNEAALMLNIQEHLPTGKQFSEFFLLTIEKLMRCGLGHYARLLILRERNKVATILYELNEIMDQYSDIQLN